MALRLGMVDAKIISSKDIYFDPRAILKCKWGCDDPDTEKCSDRGIPHETRIKIVESYKKILLVHSHNIQKLYSIALEIERQAFLDGHYFAFTICSCDFCKSCEVKQGNECPNPEKIRPCDQLF